MLRLKYVVKHKAIYRKAEKKRNGTVEKVSLLSQSRSPSDCGSRTKQSKYRNVCDVERLFFFSL